MELKVSNEAITHTTKCSSNYHCLKDNNSPECPVNISMCKVDEAIGDYLRIEWNYEDCLYKLPFGRGFMCTCPIRNEIYKRYKM